VTDDILDVHELSVDYKVRGFRKPPFRAVRNVSFAIPRGETLGLVGESGSGKSTIGRAVLGLAPVASGRIDFDGRDIAHLSRAERRAHAGGIQAVFQDPYSSLNPSMTIGDILAEPLTARGTKRVEAQTRVRELLTSVGLPSDAHERFPRQFSGGQRQRIAIARALALSPRLIVCDEPVSALDLTTQSVVLDLFIDIQRRTGVSYLFVSHDLAVIRHISHSVAVMKRGELVEVGDGEAVTRDPQHPYTQRLLLAAPVPDPAEQEQRRAQRQRLIGQQSEADEQAGGGLAVTAESTESRTA
jgi:ABC-type glutathione transport system ATPase component